jgi:hypothetical protein
MAFEAMNLAKTEFPTSNLFNYLPRFEEIYYQGNPIDRVQLFKAVREGQECKLLAVTIIRKDEDFCGIRPKTFWTVRSRMRRA